MKRFLRVVPWYMPVVAWAQARAAEAASSTVTPQLDGGAAITLILVASFAIDRVVTSILFLLGWAGVGPYPQGEAPPPKADHTAAKSNSREAEPNSPPNDGRLYKLTYFLLGGVLSIFVLAYFGDVRLMKALGYLTFNPHLDYWLTGIVLVGGADRIASLIKPGPGPGSLSARPPEPTVIKGKLIVEEPLAKKAAAHND